MSIMNNIKDSKMLLSEISNELQSLEMWSWDELLGHIPESDGVENSIVSSIQKARRLLELLTEKIG